MLNKDIKLSDTSTQVIKPSNRFSRFIRFDTGSTLEKTLFPSNRRIPYIQVGVDGYEEVHILKIVVFGGGHFLVELMNNEDFIKYCKGAMM